MRTESLIVVLIAAGIVVAVLGGYLKTAELLPQQACTMEAKICPDGSTVGRTGPNCEFAACPAGSGTTNPVTLVAKLGETVTGGDVSITPLQVLEDSRCPVDVECIQAGTVRVRTNLSAGMGAAPQDFTLGKPITTEAETVTLSDVSPVRHAGVSIAPGDYRFTFTVLKRSTGGSGGILPYNSGVRGAVVLGPTCPVMRNPPDPQCADKPYATAISVNRTGSSAVFATTQSDANGVFQLSLPPGTYTVSAQGGQMLPRCASQDVTVGPAGYVTITISCDTGIR